MSTSTNARRTWSEFAWPSWVPESVRSEVEGFWAEEYGRGPDEWLRNTRYEYNAAPEMGAYVTVGLVCSNPPQYVTGRYVHAWNNIGRLVDDTGIVHMVHCRGWKPAPRPAP